MPGTVFHARAGRVTQVGHVPAFMEQDCVISLKKKTTEKQLYA